MLRQAFYYDNRSNLTCVLDPEDGLTYFTFDAASRMTSVKNPWGQVAYYDYTPGGRLTKRVLGNGCVTYYGYDLVGQVEKIENRKGDLSVLSSFGYQRDLLGNPVSILREDGAVVYYEYDAKSQLTKETQRDPQGQTLYAWEWAYDPAGNRLWQVFNGEPTYHEYNAANELLTTGAGTTYYDYDRCGNTVAKREPGGATTEYHWDYENLLRRVDLPDGGHNYFAYDADGKRVEKRDSAGTTRFTYQAGNMLALLQERDASGDLTAHYTMGNGLEAMQRDTGSGIEDGSVSFFHYDALGSTFELTDEAQAVTDTYRYNAWGEVLERTGDTDNPHMYVGKERYYGGQDLGLYLLGLRWYDQGVGRFVTTDVARDGERWYAYADSLPVAKMDPEGAEAWPSDKKEQWDRATENAYHLYVKSHLLTQTYQGQYIPCNALALLLLQRFAKSHRKRLIAFGRGDGAGVVKYDSCLDKPVRVSGLVKPPRYNWRNSPGSYFDAVNNHVKANDIARIYPANTTNIPFLSARAGDYLMYYNEGGQGHTRVIYGVYEKKRGRAVLRRAVKFSQGYDPTPPGAFNVVNMTCPYGSSDLSGYPDCQRYYVADYDLLLRPHWLEGKSPKRWWQM